MQLLLGCDRLHPPAASFAWLAGCRSMQLQVVSAGSFRSTIVKQSTHQDISSILPAPTKFRATTADTRTGSSLPVIKVISPRLPPACSRPEHQAVAQLVRSHWMNELLA
mmetsp:Transcript_13906/g.27013  ORF Transcript_13906/g.27013 Transcript_13906/m.27013 type:complete len:109 (-) Transcript_13906:1258-1584(-)